MDFELQKVTGIMKNKLAKKISGMLIVAVIASSTLIGCGDKDKNRAASETAKEIVEEVKEEESTVAPKEEVAQEESAKKEEEKEDHDYSGSLKGKVGESAGEGYEEFSDIEFWFSSGAGGWGASLYVNADGSFSGSYSDSDMGTIGEGYQYGTVYQCDYVGQFDKLTKVDDYRYKTTIKEMNYTTKTGTEEIIDEVRYVYTGPYGLEEAKDIYFCLPGMPEEMITEDARFWFMYAIEDGFTKCYSVINDNQDEAFIGYKNNNETVEDYSLPADTESGLSDIEIELSALTDQSDQMVFEFMNSNLSQSELNTKSGELYKLWDDELNKFYNMLKGRDDFELIQKEQRIWVEYKEKRMDNAGKPWEDGTMHAYIVNMEAYKLTKQRVFELAEYVW